jgi:iron-sulfur cluster assembly accessory protein
MKITLSDKALAHFMKWVQQKEAVGLCLSLKKAGCVGFEYQIMPALQAQNEEDYFKTEHRNAEGVPLFLWVDKKYTHALDGLCIEYVQEGLNWRLAFNNPQVEHACGCGTSFSFKSCDSPT